MGLRRWLVGPSPGEMVGQVLEREFTEPGTEVSIQPQVDAFWSELRQTGSSRPRLIERVGGGALHAVEQPADGVDAVAVRGDVPAGVGVEPGSGLLPERDQRRDLRGYRSMYGWGTRSCT